MTQLLDENFAGASSVSLSAARAVKRRYPTADTDDLTQVGLMWCIEHPRKFREYVDNFEDRKLYKALYNYMSNYARSERAKYHGYSLEDEVFYSKRMLKGDGRRPGLLHYVFDRSSWESPPAPDGAGRRTGDPAEGGNWLALMCDVDRAVQTLSSDDRTLLTEHFLFEVTYEALGRRIGVSKTTAAKYVDRAVARVQDALGGSRPRQDPPEEDWRQEPVYVGGRRAITNAHARALLENM